MDKQRVDYVLMQLYSGYDLLALFILSQKTMDDKQQIQTQTTLSIINLI